MTKIPAVPKPTSKRYKPKRVDRGKFSPKIRETIIKQFNGLCGECRSRGVHIHHIKLKGSGKGRGVVTNGLLLCLICHNKIHKNADMMKKWQDWAIEQYGEDYYMDKWDKEG